MVAGINATSINANDKITAVMHTTIYFMGNVTVYEIVTFPMSIFKLLCWGILITLCVILATYTFSTITTKFLSTNLAKIAYGAMLLIVSILTCVGTYYLTQSKSVSTTKAVFGSVALVAISCIGGFIYTNDYINIEGAESLLLGVSISLVSVLIIAKQPKNEQPIAEQQTIERPTTEQPIA